MHGLKILRNINYLQTSLSLCQRSEQNLCLQFIPLTLNHTVQIQSQKFFATTQKKLSHNSEDDDKGKDDGHDFEEKTPYAHRRRWVALARNLLSVNGLAKSSPPPPPTPYNQLSSLSINLNQIKYFID